MSSGKKVFYFSGDEEKMKTNDWAFLFFTDPVLTKPGTESYYANSCTYMLSRIVERVSGCTLRNYLVPRLFNPLGIFNPQWHTCPGGHTLGATGLYLTIDDFAGLGRVFLDNGVYGDARIVSEKFIKESVADVISTEKCGFNDSENKCGYGYQLWLCSHKGAYRADGKYGQFCIVFPDREAVVTVTSHEEFRQNDILRTIYEDITPYLE